jgi:hypothetical protein
MASATGTIGNKSQSVSRADNVPGESLCIRVKSHDIPASTIGALDTHGFIVVEIGRLAEMLIYLASRHRSSLLSGLRILGV